MVGRLTLNQVIFVRIEVPEHFDKLSASYYMWYLYILLCDKKTFYIGITNNLEKRFQEHKDKKSFFTKKFSELEIIHKEVFQNKFEAAQREKQLKGWSRKKKELLVNSLR